MYLITRFSLFKRISSDIIIRFSDILNSFHSLANSSNDFLVIPGNIRFFSKGGVVNSYSGMQRKIV